MISLPPSRACFHVFVVNSGSLAKKAKSTLVRCSGNRLWMKVASSPTCSI